jgi:F-box and leucine-rich repeat protein GRR1
MYVFQLDHLDIPILTVFQGIHTLLNNCPRLTHLSLTGVQAFLRDDLTVFCREAPAEFNDHQREVFCVFSGNGVQRLREYLNRASGPGMETGMVNDSDDDGDGATLRNLPLPPPPPPHHPNLVHTWHNPAFHNPNDQDIEDEDMEDDNDGVDTPDGHGIGIIDAAAHGHLHTVDIQSPSARDLDQMIGGSNQHGGALWAGGSGEAQHVTGMMSAAMLDDVDEDTPQ